MPDDPHRCHIRLFGRSCEHDICYTIDRGVPPELRCTPQAPAGYSSGGGGCCRLPEHLEDLVERELRDNLQECRRLGYVPIRAA
jgi:hypothetical protein